MILNSEFNIWGDADRSGEIDIVDLGTVKKIILNN